MFRITCFVNDKNLPDVLRALAGRAYDVKTEPANVSSPKEATGQVNGADTMNTFASALRALKKKDLIPADLRDVVQGLGWAPTSTTYYINQAIKAGILKRGAKNGTGYHYKLV